MATTAVISRCLYRDRRFAGDGLLRFVEGAPEQQGDGSDGNDDPPEDNAVVAVSFFPFGHNRHFIQYWR